MNSISRRSFFKMSGAMTSGALLTLSSSQLVNAQSNESQIFLPLISTSLTSTSEVTTILQKLHLDDNIIDVVSKADPYIDFVDNEYQINTAFDANSEGMSSEDLNLLNQILGLSNTRLQNHKELLDAHITSYNRVYAAGCNRSGTEWGWIGWYYKIYLNDEEANELARDLGRSAVGTGILAYWARLSPVVQLTTGVSALVLGAFGQWITERNNGCGVIFYMPDMGHIPFWISPQ